MADRLLQTDFMYFKDMPDSSECMVYSILEVKNLNLAETLQLIEIQEKCLYINSYLEERPIG